VAASCFCLLHPLPHSIGLPAARLSHLKEYCVELGNNRRLAEFHMQMEEIAIWKVEIYASRASVLLALCPKHWHLSPHACKDLTIK
jgi:hypothetical protein